MYQRLFLCCALFLIVLRAGANNITLHFKEAGKLNRLMSVRIKCILANQSVVQGYSDSLGTFTLKMPHFRVQLRCSLLGYSSFSKQINPSDLTTGAGGPEYTVLLERNVQNIQEVVVTGQAQPVLAKQSIYKVNTISAEQIAQRGAVNLGDVLGFEMNQLINNDNILGSSVSMGGLGGQNVKILVNGIPVAGRENGNIDLGQLNMNNIKRVEMIQGPMSVMYGSNALGGVINLITNTPTRKLNFNVRTYLESIGRYNFRGKAVG
ncbi:MAG: TonB-dependent receptor plug domain-containing protein [Bacteroidota bacterium]|nr:MAG: TonB-dependent receptor plug domain-containing protein [Bacteroidota bacterium]